MKEPIQILVDVLEKHLENEQIPDDFRETYIYDYGYYKCKLAYNIPMDEEDMVVLEWYSNVTF